MINPSSQHIIFSTENTSLIQDDNFEGFILKICDCEYKLDRFGYPLLRKKIKAINLVDLISSKTPDVEIIYLLNAKCHIVVDIHLAIELKDLMAGTSAMLELNACIHKGIKRKAIHA